MKKFLRTLAVTVGIIFADQLTKLLIRVHYHFPGNGQTIFPGFFDLRYVQNPGAAWGMLAGKQVFLIVFSLVALAFIWMWFRHEVMPFVLGWLALGLLSGGIIGNLIDRVTLGYVVDFLDFYYKSHHFPAFNIADSSICIGIALLMISQWRADRFKKT